MDICWSRDLNYNNGIPKSNCQLKIRKIKGCFGSLSFSLSVYDQKFVWGGGAFFAAPGYNRVIKVKILKQIIFISVVSGSLT